MKWNLLSHLAQTSTPNRSKDLTVRSDTLSLIEVWGDKSTGKDFLDRTPVGQAVSLTSDKWDHMKLKLL